MDNIAKYSSIINELSRAISSLTYIMSSDDLAHEWCAIEHIKNALNALENGKNSH